MDKWFLESAEQSFSQMLAEQLNEKEEEENRAREADQNRVQVDDLIVIRQLKSSRATGQLELEDGEDLGSALGQEEDKVDLGHRLEKMLQLTGFSDPIYAECYLNVHQYDITLEVTLINQTLDTLVPVWSATL